MLQELIQLTATETFRSHGGMRITETVLKPWETPDARFIFELWTDDRADADLQIWELTCRDLINFREVPIGVIPGTELKLLDDHPVLWGWGDEVYYTITSKAGNIAAIMGDLFIEHSKACGNWIDFAWFYQGLPNALAMPGDNQLTVPARLQHMCFQVFETHGVQYRIITTQHAMRKYEVLYFSQNKAWPDEMNFRQPYIVAEEFSAKRMG
jgi:hypothetical protein